jgi:2-polyprenyl-3-methyl-5-hydroxy-6-metoxy-1,4-benzoquinol methylase
VIHTLRRCEVGGRNRSLVARRRPTPVLSPQVLTFLGDVAGQRVVELGAGIGRFTRPLAQAAASVVAIDFMQTLIDQNAKANADCANVDFRCGDATELDLPAGETDCLFSNWLLMYLSDAEVAALAAKALAWVADGGTVFFRESCFRQSGDTPRASNPTHYRDPRSYFDMFDGARAVVAGGRHARWELVGCRCVEAYVKLKANQNQLCWKWRKVVADEVWKGRGRDGGGAATAPPLPTLSTPSPTPRPCATSWTTSSTTRPVSCATKKCLARALSRPAVPRRRPRLSTRSPSAPATPSSTSAAASAAARSTWRPGTARACTAST